MAHTSHIDGIGCRNGIIFAEYIMLSVILQNTGNYVVHIIALEASNGIYRISCIKEAFSISVIRYGTIDNRSATVIQERYHSIELIITSGVIELVGKAVQKIIYTGSIIVRCQMGCCVQFRIALFCKLYRTGILHTGHFNISHIIQRIIRYFHISGERGNIDICCILLFSGAGSIHGVSAFQQRHMGNTIIGTIEVLAW